MEYTQLGKTDLTVSRICFGCWQLSPKFWGDVDLEPWKKAVVTAVDAGVNFFDTADAYGNGYSEDELGRLMESEHLRDKIVLATKFYHNFEKEERHPDTSYAYILRECEAQLKRLRTDHIDLYQIHASDPLMRPEEVAAAFGQLRKEGKVRWFGVSNWNADEIRMGLKFFDIACLQPRYNLLAREPERNQFPVCLENRIGVIPYSPLGSGALAGKYGKDQVFDDFRKNRPAFQSPKFPKIVDAMESLKPLAEKYGLTLPELVVRWNLTHPAVTSPIVGVKKPEHITGVLKAVEGRLSIEDWHVAARAFQGI